MPLVRYEVQCEHSLANPELFRSAARDDPEGLLEGVAVAGLIGIVRQLGDLAEFAAEVFRDLHKELTSVGGRAHDLTVRVQQLETELPAVEKTLLSEPNQLRFAYTNGADWHASIRSDQNHCTSGELPRFIRNFYEGCRGPPRLFLLDKFDAAGSGACLKRYTDPSFFKLEWARSELLKAQRAQRDKKARREKKKGRRRKTGQAIAAINQIPARVRYGSASLDDLDSLSHLLASTLKDEVASSSSKQGPGAQTHRRSNLGSKGKTNGGSLPPLGPSAAQGGGGGTSKALKISAKDIEANVSGKFYQPSEPEGVAESMAGKITKIIEMGDRNAGPGVGLVPRSVDQKIPKGANGSEMPAIDVETNRVTKKDLEAAAMARTGRTSRGSSRSNVSMDARELQGSKPGNSRSSEISIPGVTSISAGDSTGHPGLQANTSRTGSLDVRDSTQFAADVSQWSVDAKLDAHVGAGGVQRHRLGGHSRSDDNAGSTSPDGVLADESVKEQIDGSGEAEDRHGESQRSQDSAHSRKPSHQHARKWRQSTDPGTQSSSIHDSPAIEAAVSGGVDEEQRHNLAEAGAVERGFPSNGYGSDDSPLSDSGRESGFHDGHALRVANNARNTRAVSGSVVEAGYQQPDLPPVRVEEVLVDEEGSHTVSVLSPIVLSQCSSPVEDLRPSASMLSRLSYSSELVSVSSGSEPDSPVSPKSPAFNALYSPPGLPCRTSGDMSGSPHGMFTGSYSRSDHYSGLSSPRSEILVLSSSPKSLAASSSPVAWESDTGPLRPPPPPPIGNGVPSHLENGRVSTSATYEPYSLALASPSPSRDVSTSLELDGMTSELKGESSCCGFDEIAERVPAEPSVGSGNNSNLIQNPTSSGCVGADFEARYSDAGDIEPSVADLKAEEQSGVRELSTSSPFGLPDSGTKTSQTRFNQSDPEAIPELRRVDVPFDGPTSDIDPPVEESQAGSFGEDRQGQSSNVAFTDFVRSSLILPPRPSNSPSSSAHTSPLGSPKQRFQRIFLTNPSVQPTPSPLGQAMTNGGGNFPVEDEESMPSSPTGSVIIKDTPSPPGSPASNYSENEFEIHEFEHPDDELKSQAVQSPLDHALAGTADAVVAGKASSDETNVQEDPGLKLSESDLTSAVCVRSDSASKEVGHGLSGDGVEIPSFDSPVHREISNEEILLHVSPPTSPRAGSGRTSPVHGPEAGVLKPVSSRIGPKSRNSSASNSPPESPPRKEYLGGDDGSLRAELRGRSSSKSWTRLAPGSPGRSPSNSPPTSPPRFSDQAGSLRWRRRSSRESVKPDFSLPPNLVCQSETSSPPCSPPPQSESESPKQWDEGSDVSSSSDSSDSSVSAHGHENGGEEVYRLSDSPLPLDSPTISEAGDRSSGSSSRCESDAEGDKAGEHEDGMVHSSSSADPSKLESPSCSMADEPQNEVVSSGGKSAHDGNEPNEAHLRSSTFYSSVKPEMPNSPSQEISIQQPSLGNERHVVSKPKAFEPPPAPPAPGSADIPASKDALAAAIAHHDWNMMKALTFKDPGYRPVPPPDERSILLEQIRSESFSLHRADDSLGGHGHITRPSGNINVAAILEKANAIRQAFVGSDDEDGDEDDWSDS